MLNIANKPFETKGFTLKDFINALTEHLGTFPFNTIIANNNNSIKISNKHKKYKYIKIDEKFINQKQNYKVILKDVINKEFPLYHDSKKLAKSIIENI